MRVYYEPDYPDAEPFVFSFGGCEYSIQPKDQWWRRIQEEYVVGYKSYPNGQPNKDRPVTRIRDKWIPDEDRNEAGLPVANFIDVSRDVVQYLKRQKFVDFRPYLKFADEEIARRDQSLRGILKDREEMIDRMRKSVDLESKKLRAQFRAKQSQEKREYAKELKEAEDLNIEALEKLLEAKKAARKK